MQYRIGEEDVARMLRKGRLSESLAGFSLTKDRPNFLPFYIQSIAPKLSGTLMPPSPGVKAYTINVTYDSYENRIRYRASFKFREGTLHALKSCPKEQLLHRSRSVALAARPLQLNEFTRRVGRMRENKRYVNLLKSSISQQQREHIYSLVHDATMIYFAFNMDYIRKYIKEHRTSSTGVGVRWNELEMLTPSDWRDLYEMERGILRNIASSPGSYNSRKYNLGIRARSNELPYLPTSDDYSLVQEVDRSRIVMFMLPTSVMSLFIPDKTAWYTMILKEVEDLLGINYEVHYPMVEGGQVYVHASDYLQDGYKQYAYDGGNWESVVGEMLSPDFRPYMTQFEEQDTLPSGISFTSLLGTICMLAASRLYAKPGDKVIMLGDDLNIYTKRHIETPNLGSLIELQAEDSRYNFMLGLAYKWDPIRPRLVGLKLTTDRADKVVPMHFGVEGYADDILYGSADERTTAIWLGMYHGAFAGSSLIDRLKGVPAERFRGGSEEIHRLAEDEYKELSLDDAMAWEE